MSENDTNRRAAIDVLPAAASGWAPAATNDAVMGAAPAFALGSMMIAASQSNARAMELAVATLGHNCVVSLATTSQCVNQILGAPTEAQQAFMAALQAKMFP